MLSAPVWLLLLAGAGGVSITMKSPAEAVPQGPGATGRQLLIANTTGLVGAVTTFGTVAKSAANPLLKIGAKLKVPPPRAHRALHRVHRAPTYMYRRIHVLRSQYTQCGHVPHTPRPATPPTAGQPDKDPRRPWASGSIYSAVIADQTGQRRGKAWRAYFTSGLNWTMYGNFDIILDHFPRISQPHPTPHASWVVFYLVPSLTSC